jgi:hypothetical protein
MSEFTNLRSGDQPFDRLTGLCARMTHALAEAVDMERLAYQNEPERNTSDVKTIVFIEDDKSAGIQTFGYTDSIEAMASLFVHMKAIFEAQGKHLDFVSVPDSPEGLS